jgi:hypothetical protein
MTIRMRRPSRRPHLCRRHERGQVVVLFALAAIVVLGMAAVAVDGGFGLVQLRRAQNAADFAAVAGTNAIKGVCQGGGSAPSNAAVFSTMQSVIDQNSSAVAAGWTGTYLDKAGATIPNPANYGLPWTVSNSGTTYPPSTACGVAVRVSPSWSPFLARIMGVSSLSTTASARSILNPGTGQSVAIVALDQVEPHAVLGGGTGTFSVYGTIFANSTVPWSPWNQTHNGVSYDDVVDAKDTSNLILHGIMETVGPNWPLDWCFGTNGGAPPPYNSTPPGYPPTPDPYNTATCSASSSVVLKYDLIVNNQTQLTDPLLPGAGGSGVDDPFATPTQGLCPQDGNAAPARTVPASVQPPNVGTSGTTVLLPGDYANPVVITSGNVQFADCSGAYDLNPSGQYPGVFRFEKGLAILTQAGTTVQGNNVMIATGSPVPIPGNVPGSWSGNAFTATGTGNGAPCYPSGVTNSNGQAETDSRSVTCGGTTSSAPAPFGTMFANGPYKGVVAYSQASSSADTSQYGTGTNYAAILGGAGTITLTGPTSGEYRDIVLFQERSIPGNTGLDAQPGDTATVTLNGLVYNASFPCYGWPVVGGACTTSIGGRSNPYDFWDVGVPFHPGGVLQAGVGTGSGYPRTSHGTVTVNGPSVVDDFNTDGGTAIVIDGTKNTYNLPGVIGSGNPPLVG